MSRPISSLADRRWRCPQCGRPFARRNQRHSCRRVPLETHLPEHGPQRALFDALVAAIESDIGPCEPVALPCCIHLAAVDDFLAVLPHRERLEIRFTLPRRLDHPRISAVTQTGRHAWKHRVDVADVHDIDTTLLGWIAAAYRPCVVEV